MDLKKKIKGFFTLTRKGNGGFTLVELIVVIAILAILGGVAVPAYSGYVKKANMQADTNLISEIEKALTLGYYSGTIGSSDNGIIILTTDGIKNANDIADTGIATAMQNTFGDGWSELQLKYSDWNLGTAANSTMMGYINNSKQFSPENMEGLLTTIQHITGEFAGFLDGGSMSLSDDFKAYMEDAGIAYEGNSQAIANATVLYAGKDIAETDLSNDEFFQAWTMGSFDKISDDNVVRKAVNFAAVYAMAAYIDREANLTGDASYTARLNSASGTGLLTEMNTVAQEIGTNNAYSALRDEYYNFGDFENPDTNCMAYQDAMAFLGYMTAMDEAKNTIVDSSDIGSNAFFSADGAVLDVVNNCVSLGASAESLGVSNGVAIFIVNGVATHIGEIQG